MLTKTTAVNYWRDHDLDETYPWQPSGTGCLHCTESEIPWESLDREFDPEEVIYALVNEQSLRRCTSRVKSVLWSGTLPEESARMTSDGYAVSSPEMCFVQCADEDGFHEAVLYGLEICGTYSCKIGRHGKRYGRRPLTDVGKLSRYVARCQGIKGVKVAKRALMHIIGWSASPMETTVIMLLCLPRAHGGYGLPFPSMNRRLDPTQANRLLTKRDCFYCDLSWPEFHLDVEYDGKDSHDWTKRARDARRNNIIQSQGTTVFVLTWETVFRVEEFERDMQLILNKMHIRSRTRVSKQKFVRARKELRSHVMPMLSKQTS